jgi:hypothetical protein
MTMLEYCKMILEKVSFDMSLFRIELKKALDQLVGEEITELKKWCITRFGINYCRTAAPEIALD